MPRGGSISAYNKVHFKPLETTGFMPRGRSISAYNKVHFKLLETTGFMPRRSFNFNNNVLKTTVVVPRGFSQF